MELILFALLPLAVIIGALSGFAAIMKLRSVLQRLDELESRVDEILDKRSTTARTEPVMPASETGEPEAGEPGVEKPEPVRQAAQTRRPVPEAVKRPVQASASAHVKAEPPPLSTGKSGFDLYALLQQYWMVILGGICLVFAGVFLLRYTIEHGILGPRARFILALLFGVVLTVSGEWLRRTGRLAAGVHAALVASGILVIYSALLVGLHVYSLFSAETAFICMALVSVLSMMLALKHGPLMAGMGLLGAYLVPILVSTGSQNIEVALLYTLLVTAGSLWLQRYIYRPWLWWGTWLGALGWFAISLDLPAQAQGLRAFYLAALGYGCVALPFSGLRLSSIDAGQQPGRLVREQVTLVYGLLSIAMILILRIEHLNELSYPALAALPIVAMLCARQNMPMLQLLPWLTLLPFVADLLSVDIAFIEWQVTIAAMEMALHSSYVTVLLILSAAAVLIGVYEILQRRSAGYWASLALFVPLAALLLAYIRLTGFTGGLEWGVPTLAIALGYWFLLDRWRKREGDDVVVAALTIASQTALALALFMMLTQVTLTLVLALQLVAVTLIDRKMQLPVMPWIIKALLVLIILRLTFNPWLFFYDVSSEILLLAYAGGLSGSYLAAALVRERKQLKVWLDSGSAHLLVLTLAVFTRYFIYHGDIFTATLNLTEASIYVSAWAAIGIVYDWKARNMEHHQLWYRGIALLHIGAAAALYVLYNLLMHNPLWSVEAIGETAVINLVLLAYGLPLVLAMLVYWRLPEYRRIAGVIALIGLFMFVTIEVRHLWHGGIDPDLPVLDGELYTYSLAWLLLTVALLVYGAVKGNGDAQKAGMVTLVLVVLKVFLWDMGDLDGLWRVVSFLGLGLALLGIAYLFNRLKSIGDR